jgi:hypothetical protein
MLSEWTAECSHDAPTLVVPWADAASGARFIDLRADPYDIAEIPEVEHNPTLARALRSLNATRSPFLTAKCDAWTLSTKDETQAQTLEALRIELMLSEEDAVHGFASYIDVLWRERSVFASAHQQQDRLDRIVRRTQRLQHPEAALECVLRPAFLDLNGPLEGFSFTSRKPRASAGSWLWTTSSACCAARSSNRNAARLQSTQRTPIPCACGTSASWRAIHGSQETRLSPLRYA